MATLPAPYPFLPSGGDLPVSSVEDVLAVYPADLRAIEEAPVRDAVAEAQTAMFLGHQERADYAAAQSDATRATGPYLHGLGSDRGIFAQEGEDEEVYRTRIFASPDVVTPNAILDATNAILAPYTDSRAKTFDSITDRLFLSDGTASWHSFIFDGEVDVNPQYQDRRYELREGSGPGGAWVFDDSYGRYFVLRVPDLTGITAFAAYTFNGNTAADAGTHLFLSDGTVGDGAVGAFLYQGANEALSIYQSIVNTVQRIKGHGVRWKLIVEPKL